MYVLYTEYYILEGPDEEELSQIVSDIKAAGLDITEERDIKNFLGFNIDKLYSEAYHMSQPQLTNKIVSNMGL